MRKSIVFSIKNYWIECIQILIIGLISPLFLFPSMKYVWVFLIVPLVWIWRWHIRKNFFERSVLDWAVLILIIQVFVTCLIVPDLAFSLPKIAGVLLGIALFYSIVSLLKTDKLIKLGIILFLGGGLIFSILCLLGMFTFRSKYLDLLAKIKERIPQINFNLPGAEEGFHPNAVGGTLILLIPLFIILCFSHFRLKKRYDLIIKNRLFSIILFFGLSFISFVLLLTQSRGSWLALIISSCILLFPFIEKKKAYILLLLLFIPITLFLFFSVYFTVVESENTHFSTTELTEKVLNRSIIWTVGIETIKSHPFTGVGMNRIRLNPEIGYEKAHVHNHLIHIGTELGIPGLVAYLAILIGMGIMCFQVWKRSTVGWIRMAVMGLGWGQFAHMIFGLADSIPLGAKVDVFFWMSLALIAVIYNFVIKKQSQSI